MNSSRVAMAVAAHPDDIEFVMSGTLMRLQDVGFTLHYMNLADGCCGSVETDRVQTAKLRREESQSAARLLGAVFHESLTHDIEILYQLDLLRRLAAVVRQVQPEILLVHSPEDYMEDHTTACRLAVTAAFCRGMPNFVTDPPTPPVAQSVTIYHAQPHGNADTFGNPVRPSVFVDVTDLMSRKADMLLCHASQADWLDRSQSMGSYVETMRQMMQQVGEMSQVFSCAEGWRRHVHLGLCDEHADPLVESLTGHVHLSRSRTT